MMLRTVLKPKALTCAALALLIAVPACTRPENRTYFDGLYFRAKAKPINKRQTLANFTVEIRDVAQGLDAARQAGGHEGTRYCIKNFGTSRIDWTVGPETDPAALRIDNGRLTFQGTCDPR